MQKINLLAAGLTLSLALAVPVDVASAQRTVTSRAPSEARLGSVIARLKPQAAVRVSNGDLLTEGRFDRHGSDTLWLSVSGAGVAGLPVQNIQSLWTRERETKKGALIGGAVGAAAFTGFLFALISGLCESSSCSEDYPEAVAFGVGIGGGVGGLAGAGIGSLVRRWQPRYP